MKDSTILQLSVFVMGLIASMNSYVYSAEQDKTCSQLNVLHIVDEPSTAFWFFKSLHEQAETQFTLTSIHGIAQAVSRLEQEDYDAVFIHLKCDHDYNLEDIAQIKGKTAEIAIVAIVHSFQQQYIDLLFKAGVDDYIRSSDITTPLLPRLVSYAVERKKSNLRLSTISTQDSVTGLANREFFISELQQHINHPLRPHAITAVMLLDLDQFKYINDAHGHSLGDHLLCNVADRLKGAMRQTDVIARVGGDEFLILLPDMPNHDSIKRIAKNLLDVLAQAVNFQGKAVFTTASIGIATRDTEKEDVETLLKHADIAMYAAKQQGGNRYTFFTRDQQVAASLRTSLEAELHKAIEQEDFFLTFQPQVNAESNTLHGAEVLIRWNHPQHGILSPGEFIPILESTGLIAPVTEWVIYTAIHEWEALIEQGIIKDNCELSINLSPRFLSHPSFKSVLNKIGELSEQAKQHIHFEITENLFVDPENNIDNLRYIKECGFKLSMDDFGTGYSSLSYLKHFPLDCIKLDCHFTRDVTNSKVDSAITQAVINLSQDLGIDLIAEGVEDEKTLNLLKSMGCNLIQGYYYSKPLSIENFKGYCTKKASRSQLSYC